MKKCNILFTSSGRRVSLVRSFRKALSDLSLEGEIHVVDYGLSAATRFEADGFARAPKVLDESYPDFLFQYCRENKINIVIPTIDTELEVLSKMKTRLKEINCVAIISGKKTIEVAADKIETDKFLVEEGFSHAKRITDFSNVEFPVFLKPSKGSCSIGALKINNSNELQAAFKNTDSPIVQEFIDGEEYTVDVYTSHITKKSVCAVPRLRMETRAGEVSKGKTVRDEKIIELSQSFVDRLGDSNGLITVQVFKDKFNGELYINEINPRFGGGVPLSIQSGANSPKWILKEAFLGESLSADDLKWQENLLMLRYDAEIFIQDEGQFE